VTVLVVTTPAEAAAVSLCLLDRIFSQSESHPAGGCRFCAYSREQLDEAIAYFEIIAEGKGTDWHADHVRAFRALPEAEQKRLVRAAQAIPEAVPA
jgi:hypothetical protein